MAHLPQHTHPAARSAASNRVTPATPDANATDTSTATGLPAS